MALFTDEQLMIQETAQQFADDRLIQTAVAREATGRIEPQIISEMGELGFLGMLVPQEMGGVGADTVSYALALIEIARGDGSAKA